MNRSLVWALLCALILVATSLGGDGQPVAHADIEDSVVIGCEFLFDGIDGDRNDLVDPADRAAACDGISEAEQNRLANALGDRDSTLEPSDFAEIDLDDNQVRDGATDIYGRTYVFAFVDNDGAVEIDADFGILISGFSDVNPELCHTDADDPDCGVGIVDEGNGVVVATASDGAADAGDNVDINVEQDGVSVDVTINVVGAPADVNLAAVVPSLPGPKTTVQTTVTDAGYDNCLENADVADNVQLAQPTQTLLQARVLDNDGVLLTRVPVDFTSTADSVAVAAEDLGEAGDEPSGNTGMTLVSPYGVGQLAVVCGGVNRGTARVAATIQTGTGTEEDAFVNIQVVGPPDAMILTAVPAGIICDGVQTAVVTATVADVDDRLVADGNNVHFTVNGLAAVNPANVTTVGGRASTIVQPLNNAGAGVIVFGQSGTAEFSIGIPCVPPDSTHTPTATFTITPTPTQSPVATAATTTPTGTWTPTPTPTDTSSPVATPTPTTTPTPSNPGPLSLAIDCNLVATGVQSSCSPPSGSTSLTVGVVLINNGPSSSSIGAFDFRVRATAQIAVDAFAGADSNKNANPNFSEAEAGAVGTWSCTPPAPQSDEDPSPVTTLSLLSCFESTGTSTIIASDSTKLLATILYATTNGQIDMSFVGANVGDVTGNPTVACEVDVCAGARVEIGVPSTSTTTPTGTATPSPTPTRTPGGVPPTPTPFGGGADGAIVLGCEFLLQAIDGNPDNFAGFADFAAACDGISEVEQDNLARALGDRDDTLEQEDFAAIDVDENQVQDGASGILGSTYVFGFVSGDGTVEFDVDAGINVVSFGADPNPELCTTEDPDCDASVLNDGNGVVVARVTDGTAAQGDEVDIDVEQLGVVSIETIFVVGAPGEVTLRVAAQSIVGSPPGFKTTIQTTGTEVAFEDCLDNADVMDAVQLAHPTITMVQAIALDSNDALLARVPVTFSSNLPNVADVSVDINEAGDDPNGNSGITMRTPYGVGQLAIVCGGIDRGNARITATILPGSAAEETDSVFIQVVGPPYAMALSAEPDQIVCDGVQTAVVTATVADVDAHAVADGNNVRFTVNGLAVVEPINAKTAGGLARTTIRPLSNAGAGVIVTGQSGAAQFSIGIPCVAAEATATPTTSATSTPTASVTPTPTAVDTATATPTETATPSPTDTATPLPTATATASPTATATHTATNTATATVTNTPTAVPATLTPTVTATAVATSTPRPCLPRWQRWGVILSIVLRFGAEEGEPRYRARLDLDGDGTIDWDDLRLALRTRVCRR